MKVTICIGSSCHLKGSRQVVEEFRRLVELHDLKEKVELSGTFCLGNCVAGVCVDIDGTVHSVKPETATAFFEENILAKV